MLLGLKNGDSGAYVELVQLALVRAVESELLIDGIFGENTETALLEFQRQNVLEINGYVDLKTQNALEDYLKVYDFLSNYEWNSFPFDEEIIYQE